MPKEALKGEIKKKEFIKQKPKLKRALNLFHVTAYGVGIILGAGIYAIIGEGAGIAGNALWLSFFIGAIIAGITGLSYAELGTMYPKEAAEYIYTKKAFKKKSLAFLIGWMIIIVAVVAAATVTLGFAGYLKALTGIPIILGAIALIVGMSFLNYWGIKESATANVVFTIIEMVGLLMIIALAIPFFGSVDYFEMPSGFMGVLTASVLMFFAFVGFEDIVNLAEETKNPKKVIPKALIISIIVTTILYIVVSMAAVSIMPWDQISQSAAPLADVAESAMPGSGFILAIIALFATANTVLILLIVDSRMLLGMAREKSLPKFLGKIHPKRSTPRNAILLTMVVAIAFILYGKIGTIAKVTDLGVFIVFISVNASLIWLRYKHPNKKRPFKVPINIGKFPVLPFIGIIITTVMFSFFDLETALIGIGIVVLGLITYYILDKKGLIEV